MRFYMLGANYKTASVEVREKMALTKSETEEAIKFFRKNEEIGEVVVLNTCNRTEYYFLLNNLEARHIIWSYLLEKTQLPAEELDDSVFTYQDREMINHLFRVACGLDSMVLGEGQILAQVRSAYKFAVEYGGVSTIFHQLFPEALRVGKKIRTETGIAGNGASIPTAAVEQVKQVFSNLGQLKAMVLGAGQMGTMAMELLYNAGVKDLLVVNRSEERRMELAQQFNGTPVSWEGKVKALNEVDLVISSTSAPHYVVRKDELEPKEEPYVLIDIAIPRDVQPGVEDINNVQVFNIDDLQEVAYQLSFTGQDEINKAEKMIEDEIDGFVRWLEIRKVSPFITALRKKAENIRQQEMKRARSKLESLDQEGRDLVMDLTHKIIAKLLHEPTIQLKEFALKDDTDTYLSVVRELYNLDVEKKKVN